LSFRADAGDRVGCVFGIPRRWARASGVSLRWARLDFPPARPFPREDSLFTFDFDIFDAAGFFATTVVLQNEPPP
jgi:hypothetical protein